MMMRRLLLQLALVSTLLCRVASTSGSQHQSNHAVTVSSSRYWFNYRHTTNALSIYQLIKSKGIPDENIVLMLADEYAINDRNVFKNRMLTKGRTGPSLFDEATQIDYRGEDVTVDNLIRVLLGHPHDRSLPRLQSNQHSNVLVYLTGHGGDQFFKFQDVEEITSSQLAHTFRRMHELNKYQELLFVVDTCQAFTLGDHLATSNVVNVTIIGSSLKGESSYAHHSDADLGLSVTERYTAAMVDYVSKHGGQQTLKAGLIDPYPFATQRAHIGFSDATAARKVTEVMIDDFFANVANKEEDGQPAKELKSVMTNFSQKVRFQPPSIEGYQSLKNMKGHEPVDWGKGECKVQDLGDLASNSMPCSATMGDSMFLAMEPTDPIFLTLTAVLLGTVMWLGRRF